MTNFNRTILAGNLTHDPELRYTQSGKAVASLSVAINHIFKDHAGEKREDVTFVPITVWGKQAETTAQYMKKGRPIFLEGRLKQERWTDKDGQKRQRLTVTANLIRFLGKPPKADDTKQPIENQASDPQHPVDEEQDEPPVDDENIPF